METCYLMLRAYGDCLISLALLQRVPEGARAEVLGSPLATQVARLIGFERFPIVEVLGDVAGFYNVRRAGADRIVADFRTVKRVLSNHAADAVLFEHRDWRNRLIVPGRRRREPRRGRSIYEDRHALLGEVYGPLDPLPLAGRPSAGQRSIVVHPGARLPHKKLPPAIVSALVDYAARHDLQVTLIDPDAEHRAESARVHRYVHGTPLREAVNLLRGADFFIGADSFFLHLAYHFGRPSLAIVPEPEPYFAPPGLLDAGGSMTIAEAMDARRLVAQIDRWRH